MSERNGARHFYEPDNPWGTEKDDEVRHPIEEPADPSAADENARDVATVADEPPEETQN